MLEEVAKKIWLKWKSEELSIIICNLIFLFIYRVLTLVNNCHLIYL